MGRILVLSPMPSHPQDAGNRARIFRLLEALGRCGHEVTFVFTPFERVSDTSLRSMDEAWASFHLAPFDYRSRRLAREGTNALLALLSKRLAIPFGVDDWYPKRLSAWLEEHLRNETYDAVIVNYVFLSKALESFGPETLKILDTHDVFGGRHRLFQDRGEKARWFFTTEEEENRGLARADVILAIQENEAAEFRRRLPDREILTVGHGVHINHTPSRPEATRPTLLFVGSRNRANVQGLQQFIDRVLPKLASEHPNLELRVVGSAGDRLAADVPNCRILGRVDDLTLHYEEAWVVVNPMTFGTGLKIKTVEALGYGRPLVTTAVGADGIESAAGQAFLVADDPEEFVRAIDELLSEAESRATLGRAALAFAERYNSDATEPLLQRLSAHVSSNA